MAARRRRWQSCAVVLALALGATACGSSDSSSRSDSTTAAFTGGTTYPLTITNCGSTEIFAKAPTKMLTEGASAMNVLRVQLGLTDAIVKTTAFSALSDVPGMSAQLESLPRVKVASLGLSREDTIALAPVVIAGQQSYFEPKKGFATREQLHAAGIQAYNPSFFCASNVDDPTAKALADQKARTFEDDLDVITQLGQIFDVNDRAAKLVEKIRAAYDDTREQVADEPPKRVTVFAERCSAC
jgi:iron complex transport system substrate-binding protein